MVLSDMVDILFTVPLIEMHVSYDDGIKLLINNDDDY
jgi:hypothetical protein